MEPTIYKNDNGQESWYYKCGASTNACTYKSANSDCLTDKADICNFSVIEHIKEDIDIPEPILELEPIPEPIKEESENAINELEL